MVGKTVNNCINVKNVANSFYEVVVAIKSR